MFHKPLKVKSQTVLKTSDRKKFRADLESRYPGLSADRSLQLLPNKGNVTVARVHLHSGGSEVAVYAFENEPFAFVVNNVIYPTVYALWKFPEMTASIATWPQVCDRIRDGADLMLPGVIIADGCMSRADLVALKKGDVCAVHCVGIRSAIAIGEAALSGEDMLGSGMRGKGFLIRHCYGDQLWAMGSKSSMPALQCISCASPGRSASELLPLGDATDDDEAEEQQASDRELSCGQQQQQQQHVPVTLGAPGDAPQETDLPPGQPEAESSSAAGRPSLQAGECGGADVDSLVDDVQTIALNSPAAGDPPVEASSAPAACHSSPDELLYKCFLCALKTSLTKAELPVLTSNFYRNHLLPCCPAGELLDIKKTQYKKLSTFLKAMQAKGLITVEEQTPGVEAVVKFDKSHPELRSFKAWRSAAEHGEDGAVSSSQGDCSAFAPPLISETLCVTQAVLPLLQSAGYSKGDSISMQDVRRIVTDYVKTHGLQCADDKRSVTLDATLTDCLLTKADGYVERLRWTDLFERFAGKLQDVHTIVYATGQRVTKKGPVKSLRVRVEMRSGNKQVTLIDNFEQFGIDGKEMAKDIRVGVACSTSVTQLPGKQAQQQGQQQVLAQGDQTVFITRLLQDKYKVLPKYLDLP